MIAAIEASSRWLSLLGVAVIMATSGVLAYSDGDEECYVDFFADGDCDQQNNKAECGFDRGDCCACTCASTENYKCGGNGFACVDPDAACVDDDDVTISVIENCASLAAIGNGYCDEGNNKEECDYDGGDCCECTCTFDETEGDDDYRCGRNNDFACVDPSAPCVDNDSITIDMIDNCFADGIGNGYCEDYNNKPKCDYDGGDCCSCTCNRLHVWDGEYACSADFGFDCKDEAAPCFGEESTINRDDGDDQPLSYKAVPWEQDGDLPIGISS